MKLKPHQVRKPPMNLTRWKCPKCGSTNLLALRRSCHGCGNPKPSL